MTQSEITPQQVAGVAYSAIRECATTLRGDFFQVIQDTYNISREKSAESPETCVLEQIIENSMIAGEDDVPICQDTGSVWICLEIGEENSIPANVFGMVGEAVRRAYTEGHLRMSILHDALLDRTNTNDNNPAFTEIRIVPGKSIRMHVMLKGGGSDNASRLVMLPPSAGWEGIKKEVLACVCEKAANACPPLLVGIGVGGTFDKVAGLAKMALIREIGAPPENDDVARLESELKSEINALGIGPGALGGDLTAAAVHINTAPCHLATLPLAINMGCCAMRSSTYLLQDDEGNIVCDPQADTWMYTDGRKALY